MSATEERRAGAGGEVRAASVCKHVKLQVYLSHHPILKGFLNSHRFVFVVVFFFQEDEDEEEDVPVIPDSEKTPVTIVTGFLGAGKTTLGNIYASCVVEVTK